MIKFNTILFVFAIITMKLHVSGSVLFPVENEAYQRPNSDACRPLTDVENLVSPHLVLYDRKSELLGVDLKWPAIQIFNNLEANLHLQVVKKDDFEDEDDESSKIQIDHQFINYKMQYESGNTGNIRSHIQVFREK